MREPWIGTWEVTEPGLQGYLVITETHFFEVLQGEGRIPAEGETPTEAEAFHLLQTLHSRAGRYKMVEVVPNPESPSHLSGQTECVVEVCHDPGEVGKTYKVNLWIEGDTCREQMIYPDKEGEIYSWRRTG